MTQACFLACTVLHSSRYTIGWLLILDVHPAHHARVEVQLLHHGEMCGMVVLCPNCCKRTHPPMSTIGHRSSSCFSSHHSSLRQQQRPEG
eukprot:jgi/Chrzof1/12632/Cz07g01250.t1